MDEIIEVEEVVRTDFMQAIILTADGRKRVIYDGVECDPEAVDLDAHELAQLASAVYVAPVLTLADFQQAHDAHLNAAAKARRYDNIHTAALRAAYAGPWQAEGIAFAQWMDACNVAGYSVITDVTNGVRVMPTVAEYLAELPTLVLP